MGHLAFEHTLTIAQLRQRIVTLQNESNSWVMRSSKDSTAAMILAEEDVVLAKVNSDLSARMHDLQERQRKQTEILDGLLANAEFGLPSTVLPDVLPSGQVLLGLLHNCSISQCRKLVVYLSQADPKKLNTQLFYISVYIHALMSSL